MKREREYDTSGKIRKVRKSQELGIFAYNIPVEIEFDLLSKVLASNSFIPTYQESHLGIAYFQCNDPETKKQTVKELFALIPKVKFIEFKPERTQISKAISTLDTISKIVKELYTTYIGIGSFLRITNNKRKSYAHIYMQSVQTLALEVLAINYMHFKEAFLFLKHSIQNTDISAITSDSYIE